MSSPEIGVFSSQSQDASADSPPSVEESQSILHNVDNPIVSKPKERNVNKEVINDGNESVVTESINSESSNSGSINSESINSESSRVNENENPQSKSTGEIIENVVVDDDDGESSMELEASGPSEVGPAKGRKRILDPGMAWDASSLGSLASILVK